MVGTAQQEAYMGDEAQSKRDIHAMKYRINIMRCAFRPTAPLNVSVKAVLSLYAA